MDKRLLFVTGKGGVGKSTVAAALGLLAARSGKRTMICEVAQQERMSRFFHREGVGFHEVELEPGLFALSIDPHRSMEEYLKLQVRVRPLYELLFHNRIFHYFAAATPGMKEMVTVGKIWELAQLERRVKKGAKYDLVIVDAPATGHGLGILRTPKTFADIARVGPIRRQALTIHNFIRDSRVTGVVAVTTAEEMPVNETLDLRQRLRESMDMPVDAIVCNGVYPERFGKPEVEALERSYGASDGGAAGQVVTRAALAAALSEHTRARVQRLQLRRLRRAAGQPIVGLPFLFQPELGVGEFGELAERLKAALP